MIQLARKDAATAFWPNSLNDYVRIKRVLIAKPLFVAALLLLNAVFIYILLITWLSAPAISPDGIRAFKYSSIRLRGYTGAAIILDKNGEPVYTGDLMKGKATGYGELKTHEGTPVYSGEFLENRYNGEGELYFPDGAVKYRGQFKNNLFDGTGVMYYPTGIKAYEGGFLLGIKQGEGTMFGVSGEQVYSGMFIDGKIFFFGFIGGESKSLGAFSGGRTLYDSEYYTSVALRGFGVMYVLNRGENGDTGPDIVRMYDISGAASESKQPRTAAVLRETLGEPFYAGYADILAPDIAAAEELKRLGKLPSDSGLRYTVPEAAEGIYGIEFETGQKLYLESYSAGEWFYTYYFTQKGQPYLFYSVERAGALNIGE